MKMKPSILPVLGAFICLITLQNCKKDEVSGPDPQPFLTETGTVKAQGIPQGEITTKSIGAEGGKIASADGLISLTIPAGALSANTNISIQPISSTTPGGLGQAYRFLPDGQKFAKPVTLTMTYDPDSLRSGQPDVLQVVYQDAEGVWKAVKGTQVNTTEHTIAAPITHFSDWSAAEAYYLEVENNMLFYGQSTLMQAVSVCKCLQSLEEDIPLTDPVEMEQAKDWTLVGEGTLKPLGSVAAYTAPNFKPSPNPVSISVKITPFNNNRFLLLYAPVRVVNDEGVIEVKFGDNEYTITQQDRLTAVISDNTVLVGGSTPDGKFTISLGTRGLLGSFSFGDLGKGANSFVEVSAPNGRDYGMEYLKCEGDLAIGALTQGTVNIAKNNGGVLEGSFSGTLVYDFNDCEKDPEFKPVKGWFVLKTFR
jgi:hypothetical protein